MKRSLSALLCFALLCRIHTATAQIEPPLLSFDTTNTGPQAVASGIPTPSLYPNIKIPAVTPNLHRLTTSIDVDPLNPENLIVGTGVFNWLYGAYYYSTNAGRNWTGGEDFEFGILSLNKFSQHLIFGDFQTQCCGDWNALYGSTIQGQSSRFINIFSSSDRGISWYGDVRIEPLEGIHALDLRLAVDNHSNTNHRNNVYAAWTERSGGPPYQIRFARWTDLGEPHSEPAVISQLSYPNTPWEARGVDLLVLDNGHILAFWAIRSVGDTSITLALASNKSTDGGLTWGSAGVINIPQFRGVGPNRRKGEPLNIVQVNSNPSVAVDRSGGPNHGRIYLAWTNEQPWFEPEHDALPTDIRLITSADEGLTWSSSYLIRRDLSRTDQWQPRVFVDHEGTPNVLFFDSSIDPAENAYTEVTLARPIGGNLNNWRHHQISDHAWIPAPVPSIPEGFIGEYMDLKENGRYLLPVWNDNRTGWHEVYIARFPIQKTTVHSSLTAKWNLKSIPVIRDNFASEFVFPGAAVYRYESPDYVPAYVLSCNMGYWVNSPQPLQVNHHGGIVEMMGMPVAAGGNIVGSISSPVPAFAVWSDPPGIISNSVFYRYDNGYKVAKTLYPGEAYWITASGPGTLYLEASFEDGPNIEDKFAEYDRFTVTDAEGNSQDVYVRNSDLLEPDDISDLEMPPPPPDAEFDARFATGEFLRTVDPDSGLVHLDIAVDTAQYPLTLSWVINPENGIEYSLTINSGGAGKSAQPFPIRSAGSAIIPQVAGRTIGLTGSAMKVQGKAHEQYRLHPNYPNPFNPTTTLVYDLVEDSDVELALYDLLGRRVTLLVDGPRGKGTHRIAWNGTRNDGTPVSTGVYIARFVVKGATGAPRFSQSQRVILVK